MIDHMDEYVKKVNGILNPKEEILYKVQLGAFKERKNAEKLRDELKKKGYDCFIAITKI